MGGHVGVLSQNSAIDYLEISTNAFSRAMAAGWIVPQAKIDSMPRPIYGFEIPYLNEVDKLLPAKKQRGKGKTVFTPDIIIKLIPINRKWPTR